MFSVPNRAIPETNLTSSSRAKNPFEKVSIENFPMLNYINPTQRMSFMKSSCVSFAALLAEAFAVKARTRLLFMLPIPDSHFVSMSLSIIKI